jgi:hypothetical protein
MAAPNIVNVTTIIGKTASTTPSNTNAAVLVANGNNSGKVFKINMILVSNIDGAGAFEATVAINTAADGSGTSSRLASTIAVPAKASLTVIDKSTGFYLEENRSIVVTTNTASKLTFTVSYEEIN